MAAHPEVHPRSPNRVADRARLAAKLGKSDFAVTQFFFRAEDYFTLVEELAALGVQRPVIPGVMPITNLASIARMADMSGATIPTDLLDRLRAADERGGADAVRDVGVDAATELSRELLAGGAPGLHFYTMNRSGATIEIYERLRLDRSAQGVPPKPVPRSRRRSPPPAASPPADVSSGRRADAEHPHARSPPAARPGAWPAHHAHRSPGASVVGPGECRP